MATITEHAQALTPKGFELLLAHNAAAPANSLELLLFERGFTIEGDVTDNTEKAAIAYALAYNLTLAALDLQRVKVKKAKGGPAEAEFRDEVKALEALLKRLSTRAGIEDTGTTEEAVNDLIINKAPFFNKGHT